MSNVYRNYDDCNELFHHGVKGQKWGVRRYQNKDGTRTEEGKKHQEEMTDEERLVREKRNRMIRNTAIIGGAALVGGLAAYGTYKYLRGPKKESYAKIVNDSIKEIGDFPADSITLPKGSKIYRMTGNKEELSDNPIFAAHLKSDARAYKNIMDTLHDAKYQMKMKANKDLKIAGQRDAAKAYLKSTGKDKIVNYEFDKFSQKLIDRDNPQTKSFYNELKKRGFDGVIDLNDVGQLTKSPVIIFDPKDTMDSIKTHKLTAGEKLINAILMG